MIRIEDILDQHRIDYRIGGQHHHVTKDFIGVDCPWCGDHQQFHLGLSPRGFASCWKCGYHRLGSALQMLTKEPWSIVKRWLSALDLDRPEKAPDVQIHKLKVPQGMIHLTKPYRRYLTERGFDWAEIVALWGVQATGPVGRWSWRIWIPIQVGGKTVTWTSRTIGDAKPKYMAAPLDWEAMPSTEILYGEDHCHGKKILAFEGPTNVWRVGCGSVATLGVKTSQAQINALSKYDVRTICFDAESQAQRRAHKLARELEAFPGVTNVIELETGNDPVEADDEEIHELRKEYL